ncbi:MAG: lysophospholipid acyltransferase family protein [Verrucomicrobiia bacterium]
MAQALKPLQGAVRTSPGSNDFNLLNFLLGWLIHFLVSVIGGTLRLRIEDPSGLFTNSPKHPFLLAFWHNRLFLVPYIYRKYCPNRPMAALISASEDGDKLEQVLVRFNLVCVRGSTSRRGPQALRELTRLSRQGYDSGFTPDGPRGPKYCVQPGVISLAQLTQNPIAPLSCVLSRKITLNSWDNFTIPLPFSRCTVRLGQPIYVPAEADDAARENKRLELERVLQTLSE